MAIREVRQSCQILRDERFELGHQVRELTQALDTFRSSDSELRQEIHELKSSCNRLEGEKTELEKKLLSSKKCYQGVRQTAQSLVFIKVLTLGKTVRKPTDEVALIEQSLLEQTRGYDCVC